MKNNLRLKMKSIIHFYFQYLGRWFQQEAHPTLANRSGKCWSQLYTRKNEEDAYELEVTTDYVSTM